MSNAFDPKKYLEEKRKLNSQSDVEFNPETYLKEKQKLKDVSQQVENEELANAALIEEPEVDSPAPLVGATAYQLGKTSTDLANAITPDIAKEAYEYAKKGQSLFDPTISDTYKKKVDAAADSVLGKLTKARNEQIGKSIGDIRESATKSGKVHSKASEIFKKLEEDLTTTARPAQLKDKTTVEGILKDQLPLYKEQIGQKEIIKEIKAPKFPIIDDPMIEAQNKLQRMIDQFQDLSSMRNISTTASPIELVGREYISKINEIPSMQDTPTLKREVLQFDKNISPEKLQEKLDEFKTLRMIKGQEFEIGDVIESGSKKLVPVTVTSTPITKNKEVIKKVPFPIGASNPIEVVKETVPEYGFKKSITPEELAGKGSIIDSLRNTASSIEDVKTKKILNTYIEELSKLDEGLDPNMPKLKEAYEQLMKITDKIPGLEGYFGKVGELPKGMETPAEFKSFLNRAVLGKEGKQINLTTFKADDLRTKGLPELEKMMKDAGLGSPEFWKDIEDLDPIAKRYALSQVATGEVETAKYALPNLARGEAVVASSKLPAKTGNWLGEVVSKIPEPVRDVSSKIAKGTAKAFPYIAGAAATVPLYQEAIEKGLTPEEAALYASSMTAVDTGFAAGGAAMGGPIGFAVGTALPITRELTDLIAPDASRNKLELYKKLKAQGKDTKTAMALVSAEQTKDTFAAPALGATKLIKNFGESIAQDTERFIQDSQNHPAYKAYSEQLENIKNAHPEERKRALAMMEQQAPFRKMARDVANRRVEKGTFMPPKRLGE